MRASIWLCLLTGCGPVLLGGEPPDAGSEDTDAAMSVDEAGAEPKVQALVRVAVADGCEGCFSLSASAEGGKSPYAFAWSDGVVGASRTVCPGDGVDEVSVIAEDMAGDTSAPQTTLLDFPGADCPEPPPLLCLQNPSFEGTAQYNDGSPAAFDGAPWRLCTNPRTVNSPDIASDTIDQQIADAPEAADGATYLGMLEGEQVSQTLCEPVEAGAVRYLQLDLRRLYIGANIAPDTELPFLELWTGIAADCSQRELLWISEPLEDAWQTHCVKIAPQHYTDQLTLRASSDGSLPTTTYLLVDHLVPVESCP